MALLLGEYILENSSVVKNCYCKIESINNLDKELMIINVEFKETKDSLSILEHKRYSIPYILGNDNPFIQGYNHLKTLEQFINCKDC